MSESAPACSPAWSVGMRRRCGTLRDQRSSAEGREELSAEASKFCPSTATAPCAGVPCCCPQSGIVREGGTRC